MNNRVRNLRRLAALLILSSCCASGGAQSAPAGDGAAAAAAGRDDAAYFKAEIQPLLEQYCINCHSTEKQKGDLDLQPFASIESVKRDAKVWQNVARQLADNEMPPEDEPQPTPAEKERLTKWVAATLDDVARSRAGDPGPVVLRRLSN